MAQVRPCFKSVGQSFGSSSSMDWSPIGLAATAVPSAAARRSARPDAAETVAAPAAILLSAERREIFVFIILAQVEFREEYTPWASTRVKQESRHTWAYATVFDSIGGRSSLTQWYSGGWHG